MPEDACRVLGRAGGCPQQIHAARSPLEAGIFNACLNPASWQLAPMGGFLGVDGEKVKARIGPVRAPDGVLQALVRAFEQGARDGFAQAQDENNGKS